MTKKENHLKLVMAGLMLGIFIAAMDQTIVATAMGTIVADLGGLDKFVWVTSAYLVAEMAGMPIFGKLSDMYGRKKFFLFGIAVFLLGSILSGTAESITQLSIYRAIQGIGGGALMPIAFAIIFDVYPAEKRGQMSGIFGAVFGMSSLFGPLLGAYITDNISWHWIFYINLPLGLLALALLHFSYHESHEHSKQKIDWSGAATLVGAVVSLMFALELGGKTYAWDSAAIIGLFAAFAILFTCFLFIERKAAEPIISFRMFKHRLFAVTNLVALMFTIPFIVATVFIPIYIQGVFGGTATNSGLLLLPMMLGMVAASVSGGILANKISYRNIMVMAVLFLLAGVSLLSTLTTETPRYLVTIYMIITGFGTGFSFSVLSMAAIHKFKLSEYGSANSTIAFVREFGMTVGITIYGTIQSHLFFGKLTDIFAGFGQSGQAEAFKNPRVMLSPEAREHIPPQVLEQMTTALSSTIAKTFMWSLIPAVIAFACIWFMGGESLGEKMKQMRAEQAEKRKQVVGQPQPGKLQ
ncbi:MAG TPA: MDR family MFS transporter [Bacillales bacterium]|nr:MDR family MFS transporter [Bacillales bacterium]